MAIEVQTTDCTALSDSDFAAMADLSAESLGWETGPLSKQAEDWVLASQAFDKEHLRGFMFTTLERIGGTPALVIGVAAVAKNRQRGTILKALMCAAYHKALMAFPDEDVIVATRLVTPGPLEALAELQDVRPWPETRANGEERAWGRRLSKRFGAVDFNDRTMIALGDGEHLVFDHESIKKLDGAEILDDCDSAGGEYVIGWGWAMAEFLEKFDSPVS
ncbi:MAG: hypothetical protein GY724_05515 [Actinomycetia bacterium]|nr:hypothetical protein [Actinomycetes bacterium]MCP4222878.1 hypothetical protein [Actinomycetes bacterium]MCP5034342.1 hypothetical protein [Actinomycetes bacterium]